MHHPKHELKVETFTNIIPKKLEEDIAINLKQLKQLTIDKHLIGKIAIFTGIVSFIPIMYEMWKTKNTANFTWVNLFLALFSNLMWLHYGMIADTPANLWSGVLYFGIYLYILIFKIIY